MQRVMISILAVLVTLCLFVSQGIAGPFGLSMGMTPEEFKGKLKKGDNPGVYRTKDVPNPHSAFEEYLLVFSRKSGLCKIMAVGKDISTSVYGTDIKSGFEDMEERLTTQYGKGGKHDFIPSSSLWQEPQYFMMGLLKKERVLTAFWQKKDIPNLKDNLDLVYLQTSALSTEKGYLKIDYEFENFRQCLQEIKASEDNAL